MNALSYGIIIVLAVLVVLDIKYLRKNGFSDCATCGGSSGCSAHDCSGCGGSCKFADDIKKAEKELKAARSVH